MTSPTRTVVELGERYRGVLKGEADYQPTELTLFEMAPTGSKVCARCDRPIDIAKVDGIKRWTAPDQTPCPEWPLYFCVPANFCVTPPGPEEVATMKTPDTNQPPTTSDPYEMVDTSRLVPLFELDTDKSANHDEGET